MVHRSEPPAAPTTGELELKKDWKFYVGIALLALSFLTPLAAIVVPFLGLPSAMAAVIAGFCLLGAPEICALVAIALLGKQTWNFLVSNLKMRIGPAVFPSRVSRSRYYFGLTLNIVSIVPLYLAGYVPQLLPQEPWRLYTLVVADLAFVISFFILGGQFWEKFKQLFVYE